MTDQSTKPRSTGTVWAELMANLQLAWRLLVDPRVSIINKTVIPFVGLLYLVLPIDLLPDVIPILGQLDDLAILLLALRLFIGLAPAEVVAQHRADLMQGRPDVGRHSPGPGNNDEVVDADYRVL